MLENNEKLTFSSERELFAADRSKRIREYISASTAENTRKTYRSAVMQFERWGGRLPATKDMVLRYLLDRAQTLCPSTVALHMTAISRWHCYQGLSDPISDPMIKRVMIGIRRKHGRPPDKAAPLTIDNIMTFVAHILSLDKNLKRVRDIALIQIGFFGAFRRSELVSIRFDDLSWSDEGVVIRLGRSKTDQEGRGLARAIPFGKFPLCPVGALRDWISASGLSSGPLFRSVDRWNRLKLTPLDPSSINIFLKTLAAECGLNPERISSHSLRRGFSTAAAKENIRFNLIKKQGGWKNDSTVYGYIEDGQHFSENAAAELMRIVNMGN